MPTPELIRPPGARVRRLRRGMLHWTIDWRTLVDRAGGPRARLLTIGKGKSRVRDRGERSRYRLPCTVFLSGDARFRKIPNVTYFQRVGRGRKNANIFSKIYLLFKKIRKLRKTFFHRVLVGRNVFSVHKCCVMFHLGREIFFRGKLGRGETPSETHSPVVELSEARHAVGLNPRREYACPTFTTTTKRSDPRVISRTPGTQRNNAKFPCRVSERLDYRDNNRRYFIVDIMQNAYLSI